jgi:hypothetical protein
VKTGADNPRMVLLAVVLVAIAAYVIVRNFGGTETSPTPAAQQRTATPGETQAPAAAGRTPRGRADRSARIAIPQTLDPTLRLDILAAVESKEYEGKGRNIFSLRPDPPPPMPKIPEPVKPVVTDNQPQMPPGPPPPPPINLKFYGMASRAGEPKRVFLSNGDDIFMGGEGDIVNRRYRIVRIGTNTVEIEDVLSNSRQTIPMTQG